ncbi:MAG: MarR family transcriptional regulator [Streptococcaceae bacterium]|jgi:DNA-binding MarR family transcriptional regulator|nr:MarR family transcriptional regulator [Streptococcaceae bacterium]
MDDNEYLSQQLDLLCLNLREMDAIYVQYAKKIGVSHPYLKVLDIIYFFQKNQTTCTQKNICEQSFLPKQTVNSIVTALCKDGFLELKESTTDRRTKMILLTDNGFEKMSNLITKMLDAQFKAFAMLKPESRKILVESLTTLNKNLKELI